MVCLGGVWLSGCGQEAALLDSVHARAASDRDAASAELVRLWRADRITLDAALNAAHEALESIEGDGQGATAFAGAVLDFAQAIEREIPVEPERSLILLRRIGQLAFKSANAAHERDRLEEARSLVLSGPERWQTDTYWERYPAHDALASLILARSGEYTRAVGRLVARRVLTAEAEEMLRILRRNPPR